MTSLPPRTTSPPAGAELPLAPGAVDRARQLALRCTRAVDTNTALLDHVIAHAEHNPARPAVVDGERTVSYGQLLGLIAQSRDALEGAGVRAGDIVAAVGSRSVHTPVLFLALEALGASYLPLDHHWPEVRARDVLARSRAMLLVDYSDGSAHAARAAAVAQEIAVLSLPRKGASATPPPRSGGHPHAVRYTIFTSGTTGRPKGATIEHQGMINHLWAKASDLALGPDDALAFTAPLVFDISIWQMLCPLLVGGRLVVVGDDAMRLPRWLIGVLDAAAVTVVELVPTAIGWLVDHLDRAGQEKALPELRWLLSTGEELYPALAERALKTLPHVSVVNAYGPTECSDDVTHHVVTAADLTGARLPVGTPVANTALYVLVQEEGSGQWRAAQPGESGELFVGGTGVGLGYLNDPDTTDRAFFRDPFDADSATGRLYRTGDLARIDSGVVHYLGRGDRQVKVSGVRMELGEIEVVLSRHPAVEQCAVVVVGEGERGELVAHYSVRTPIPAPALQEALSNQLPLAMVPGRWQEWHALPLTHNGKVDHRLLHTSTAPHNEAT